MNWITENNTIDWDEYLTYCSRADVLQPFIEEAERVHKIPWSASMIIMDNVNKHFNYQYPVETYEETMQRRKYES